MSSSKCKCYPYQEEFYKLYKIGEKYLEKIGKINSLRDFSLEKIVQENPLNYKSILDDIRINTFAYDSFENYQILIINGATTFDWNKYGSQGWSLVAIINHRHYELISGGIRITEKDQPTCLLHPFFLSFTTFHITRLVTDSMLTKSILIKHSEDFLEKYLCYDVRFTLPPTHSISNYIEYTAGLSAYRYFSDRPYDDVLLMEANPPSCQCNSRPYNYDLYFKEYYIDGLTIEEYKAIRLIFSRRYISAYDNPFKFSIENIKKMAGYIIKDSSRDILYYIKLLKE